MDLHFAIHTRYIHSGRNYCMTSTCTYTRPVILWIHTKYKNINIYMYIFCVSTLSFCGVKQ